jgi:hypothetical protein
MLSTYNISPQTVAIDGELIFSNNLYQTGCSTVHVPGSTTIELRCPGTYLITFNGTAAATAAATDPIIVQLFNGTTAIPGAVASELSATATDFVNLAFSTIIQIRPSCPSISNTGYLTVQNTGIEASFTTANFNVVKVAC